VTLRIARLHGQSDLRLETLPDSDPGRKEVLVALGAGGICGSDLHYWQDGGFGPIRVREPIILGHEAAGTVVALGPEVTTLAVGDVVALNPSHPCGTCKFCKQSAPQHCLSMRFKGSALRFPHEQGMFRDRIVMQAAQCHRIAPGVPMSEAALAEPLAVCLRAFRRAEAFSGSLAGKRVLVTGAGPIGALCTVLAARSGAAEVVVTDLQDATLAVAALLGATGTVNVTKADLAPWSEDKGAFDLAFECSGAAPALRSAVSAVRPMGTIIQVGVSGDLPVPINLIVGKEIALVGTHRFHEEFAEAVDLINERNLPLGRIVTHAFPLDRVQEAMETAADRSRSVKVQVTFG
jgi:L-idonate 5-dehydrogenase